MAKADSWANATCDATLSVDAATAGWLSAACTLVPAQAHMLLVPLLRHPFLLYFIGATAALACTWLLTYLSNLLVRCIWSRQSTTLVRVASACQAEWRTGACLPRTSHQWSKDAPSSSNTPLVCGACFVALKNSRQGQHCKLCGTVVHHSCARSMPANCKPLALPPSSSSTELGVQQDQQPPERSRQCLACSCLPHDWRPAGCTVQVHADTLGRVPSMISVEDCEDEAPDACLYCREPCEVGLIAVEPVWVCSYCHNLAHVQCVVLRHPQLFSKATKAQLKGQVAELGADELTPDADGAIVPAAAADQHKDGAGRSDKYVDGTAAQRPLAALPHNAANMQLGGVPSHTTATSAAGISPRAAAAAAAAPGPGRVRGRPPGKHSGPARLRAHSDPGMGSPASTPTSPRTTDMVPVPSTKRSQQNASTQLQAAWATQAEACTCKLGPLAKFVLSPIHIRRTEPPASEQLPTLDGVTVTSKARLRHTAHSIATAAAKWRRKGTGSPAGGSLGPSSTPARASGGQQDTRNHKSNSTVPSDASMDQSPFHAVLNKGEGNADASTKKGEVSPASGDPSRKTPSSWWKRVAHADRWSQYSLATDTLPSSGGLLLVMVNVTSGPQLGRTLHQQLLQLLHPLQVVELPSDDPLSALRFFTPAAQHLRVLVLGGDGTVAWILGIIDVLCAELGPHWTPPAVGVLPMGTGNDLARSLGWGGTSARLQSQGLVHCLMEFMSPAAHTVPLDRWNITFTRRPQAAQVQGGRPSRIKRLLSSGSRQLGQGASHEQQAGTRHSQEAPLATKVLNNYLGVGIDAKVALHFHQTRSAYPFWFQSQLGNKVWYTGLGAPDLLRRSCADLHRKMELVCDGVVVPVPEDAQGLVITNIQCHMGGVHLWENGWPAPPIPMDLTMEDDEELSEKVARLTSNKRMAIADGLIEVVAIGGVAHMGRLAVGLARAQRLAQCSALTITTNCQLPMQVDGEPWLQEPCRLHVGYRGQALVLRHVGGGPAQRVVEAVDEALAASYAQGIITSAQQAALAKEVGKHLEAVLS